MNDIMIDIETMGLNPYAPIVAIAAASFNIETGDINGTFYNAVSLEDSMKSGAKPDAETILWWLEEAIVSGAAGDFISAKASEYEVLGELKRFVLLYASYPVEMWCNGASFDFSILRTAFRRHEIQEPWEYWKERDVRTLVHIGRDLGIDPKKTISFPGLQHNALNDVLHQIKYTSAIYQHIKELGHD